MNPSPHNQNLDRLFGPHLNDVYQLYKQAQLVLFTGRGPARRQLLAWLREHGLDEWAAYQEWLLRWNLWPFNAGRDAAPLYEWDVSWNRLPIYPVERWKLFEIPYPTSLAVRRGERLANGKWRPFYSLLEAELALFRYHVYQDASDVELALL